MSDWYLKSVLTIIAAALVFIALRPGASPAQAHEGKARATGPVCQWTYIQDSGGLAIGRNGEVNMSNKYWAAVSAGGWRLVTTAGPNNVFFVFERCM